ncbi:hypothetical protein ANN_14910 [Periplaneta americana]|uniref:Uncharacterized protein n=1 Tax=Periplaneta americana TaxID=6978 RepID=A0ABQ8SXP3_PERAM|nr:hypothetical protein ANN_14910 [Periplaneta americana]
MNVRMFGGREWIILRSVVIVCLGYDGWINFENETQDRQEWRNAICERDSGFSHMTNPVEKILSSSLLSKNLKVRIYKTVILPVVLYGCETWTLTLREEQRLRVFENKILRKIFGAKRDEVTGEWRKLHNTELHALYSSPDIIRNIKSRRNRAQSQLRDTNAGEYLLYIYGCETWTLTLREKQRLRVFENKVLRKIFGAKRDEVTGEWRKLHNAELHALHSSPDIIRTIKSRRLRWAGHVARMGEPRNAYRVLVGRPEGKRPLGRPRRRWEDNIKMDLMEEGYDGSRYAFCDKWEWIDVCCAKDKIDVNLSMARNEDVRCKTISLDGL